MRLLRVVAPFPNPCHHLLGPSTLELLKRGEGPEGGPTQWWGACAPRAGQHAGEAHGRPPGRRMKGQKCCAAHTRKRGEACGGKPECGGEWAAKSRKTTPTPGPTPTTTPTSTTPVCQLLGSSDAETGKKRPPQQPTDRSNPTQHAKGRTGDCPGPRIETATRRNVTQGGGLNSPDSLQILFHPPQCVPLLLYPGGA